MVARIVLPMHWPPDRRLGAPELAGIALCVAGNILVLRTRAPTPVSTRQ